MATENNEIHVNTFVKGMNSDSAPELIPSEQYRYGLNIRLSSYIPLNNALEPNQTSGAISPVPEGKEFAGITMAGTQILCTASTDNIGVVVTADKADKDGYKLWHLYRVVLDGDRPVFTEVLQNVKNKYTKRNRINAILSVDGIDSVKLFLADGLHPIMTINIHEDNIKYLNKLTDVDQIIDRYLYPSEQIYINDKISGTLPASVIQYSYRFFKRNGVCSKVSPLTKRIYTCDYTKTQETGNANGTSTSVGYQLKIPLVQNGFDFSTIFDYCQLFRIQYGGKEDTTDNESDHSEDKDTDTTTKESEPTIKAFLVQEFKLPSTDASLLINDTGLTPLQEYTLDEYATFTGETIIPQHISYLQKSLFAANFEDISVIEDDELFVKSHTVSMDHSRIVELIDPVANHSIVTSMDKVFSDEYKAQRQNYYYNSYRDINRKTAGYTEQRLVPNGDLYVVGGQSEYVKWKLIARAVPIYDDNGHRTKSKSVSTAKNGNLDLREVLADKSTGKLVIWDEQSCNYIIKERELIESLGINFDKTLSYTNMQDPVYASNARSLMRGEVYRYGIIYYTKYGQRTDVQWIDDIKIPEIKEIPLTVQLFDGNYSVVLGLEFEVTTDDKYEYYQIVRCPKYKEWSKTLYQVVCAKPMKQTVPTQGKDSKHWSPWIPNPYIFDQYLQYVNTYWCSTPRAVDSWRGGYINGNNDMVGQCNDFLPGDSERYIVQMFSEDINVRIDDVTNAIAQSNCELYPAYTYDGPNFRDLNLALNNYDEQWAFVNNWKVIRAMLKNTNKTIAGRWYGCDYDITDCFNVHSKTRSSRYKQIAPTYDPVSSHPINANGLWDDGTISLISDDHAAFLRRAPIGCTYGQCAVLNNQTGVAFTPSLWYDTLYYDASVTKLAQSIHCKSEKTGYSATYYFDAISDQSRYNCSTSRILAVEKASEPSWEDGFSDITKDGDEVANGSKSYKGNTCFVGGNTFNNWVSSGMYDLRLSNKVSQYGTGDQYHHTNGGSFYGWQNITGVDNEELYGDGGYQGVYSSLNGGLYRGAVTRSMGACGWIGPGTRCIVAALNAPYEIKYRKGTGAFEYETLILRNLNESFGSDDPAVSCTLTNVQHTATNYSGVTRDQLQYDTYYGHGNYGKCDGTPLYVFDGDVFITPAEFTPIHKTYDFNSTADTIPSAQINEYIVMESQFNSFFDYGCNFRNTGNNNVQLEPAEITGICAQDRPQYQQNGVFAENNVTLESYTAAALQKSNTSFPARIMYGTDDDVQTTDSRTLFKANNYVDVGTDKGQITNLVAQGNTLYFWQLSAFGKLAVNERSLVVDKNDNTIQLGEGGVLQRHDYISTQYGMPIDTRTEVIAEEKLFWYDPSKFAIVTVQESQTVDLGKRLYVQNLINSKCSDIQYTSFYDVESKEINFGCFKEGDKYAQLIFNMNNVFTSMYTRTYDDCLTINGICYLLNIGANGTDSTATRINYLRDSTDLLSPTTLEFVVNNIPTSTKVFDVQQINTVSRYYDSKFVEDFMKKKIFGIKTSMYDTTTCDGSVLEISDKECNIQYALPRYNNESYGNRLRGKWMDVIMTDNDPKRDYVISSIVTKTRQSFS